MTEIPKSTQFVGSADARGALAREAAPKDEFKLNPEQQKVADVMKESGEKLVDGVVDAKEAAGQKLQGLHGKELVDIGKKQITRGMIDSVRAQVAWGLSGGLIGALVGRNIPTHGDGGIVNGNMSGDLARSFGFGAASLRNEFQPLIYNKKMKKTGELPTVRWSDWFWSEGIRSAIQFPLTLLALGGNISYGVNYAVQTLNNVILNPTVVGGLRRFKTGMQEMKKGI